MALQVNRIAFELFGAPTEEMVETHFEQRCGGCVSGNVSANAVIDSIGAHHHGQSVPANQALDPALNILIAGEHGLSLHRNRVHIGSIRGKRLCRGALRTFAQPVEQQRRGFLAFVANDCVKRLEPFLQFLRVNAPRFRSKTVIHNFLPLTSKVECMKVYFVRTSFCITPAIATSFGLTSRPGLLARCSARSCRILRRVGEIPSVRLRHSQQHTGLPSKRKRVRHSTT